MTAPANNIREQDRTIYKSDQDKCLDEMTPKDRMLIFLLVVGTLLFSFLSFVDLGRFFMARYLVFLVALALYFAVVAIWRTFRRKE